METPRKFITAKLSIRMLGSSSVLIIFCIICFIAMQTYKELCIVLYCTVPYCTVSFNVLLSRAQTKSAVAFYSVRDSSSFPGLQRRQPRSPGNEDVRDFVSPEFVRNYKRL